MDDLTRPRTYVITGSASGIGAALSAHLRARGDRVIGVDLADSDVVADLASPEGRNHLAEEVAELADGTIDAVIAGAGTAGRGPLDVQVGYFGAVATLARLRPLLARGHEPRAAVISSVGAVDRTDQAIVEACLADDEDTAVARAAASQDRHPMVAYASAKRAIARWVRGRAIEPEWAGAGIALNAVGPGIVRTPLTEPLLADPESARFLAASVPMPFGGLFSDPRPVVHALDFLTQAGTRGITGQLLFVDGGAECVRRGDDVVADPPRPQRPVGEAAPRP